MFGTYGAQYTKLFYSSLDIYYVKFLTVNNFFLISTLLFSFKITPIFYNNITNLHHIWFKQKSKLKTSMQCSLDKVFCYKGCEIKGVNSNLLKSCVW